MEHLPKKKTFYARFSWLIVASTILFVPISFYGAGRAVQTNVNKIEDWLPTSFRETGELKWFRDNFPTDQFILITWEGCRISGNPDVYPDDVDDPRIQQLKKLLLGQNAPLNDIDAQESIQYIKSVTTGRDVLDQLTSAPQSLAHDDAVERLKGSLIGPDGRQTCLLITLKDGATTKLKYILGRGMRRIFRPNIPEGVIRRQLAKVGIDSDAVRFGGPPVDSISIDEEGERTLIRLAGASGILGLVMAWWSLRSIALTFVVFSCGVLSAAVSLAAIFFTGESVDAIVLSMPSLVYVLAISGAVHLVNYFKDAVVEGGIEGATERAVMHAFKPAMLCTTTTALGLVSLYASELTPIRKFGIYSALGVVLMLGILYFFLPAALYLGGFGKRWLNERPEDEIDADTLLDVERMSFMNRFWHFLGLSIIRQHGLVMFACILFISVVGSGLYKAKTSIDLLELFDGQARILQDYRWIEQKLGMLVPLEIVVRYSPESQAAGARTSDSTNEELFKLTFLERLETTKLVQEKIEEVFGKSGQGIVGKSLSAATFAPSLPPRGGDITSFTKRIGYEKQFEQNRESFANSGYLRADKDNSELWRISLRVAAFQGVDYGEFVHELKGTIEPIMEAHKHRLEILRQLTNDGTQGKFSGRKILLWDSPTPARIEREDASPEEKARWEQHVAMVDALSELLVKARLKVTRREADPDQVSLIKMQQLNEQTDAVALVGDFTDAQVATIGSAVPKAIDIHGVHAAPALAESDQPWLTATYTGVVPIVYKAQRALLQSLVESTFWSFVTITPLMMWVSRSVRAGAVAMLPNVLPVLFIFGAMGWMGISIDIGSMMTASIALGVAVDDTIHFLTWFREDLDKLRDRNRAILVAYQRCATPTLQAALISGVGLSVFAFSTFTPTQRFGWLMLTILVAGVVAELIMLPAILAGPLGKAFESHGKRSWWSRMWLIARFQSRKIVESRTEVSTIQKAA